MFWEGSRAVVVEITRFASFFVHLHKRVCTYFYAFSSNCMGCTIFLRGPARVTTTFAKKWCKPMVWRGRSRARAHGAGKISIGTNFTKISHTSQGALYRSPAPSARVDQTPDEIAQLFRPNYMRE